MASNQNIVSMSRRIVRKIDFNNESGAFTFGITGAAFNQSGLAADAVFTNGITNGTATLSKIIWTTNGSTSGYNLRWGPASAAGATAMMAFGTDGELIFEKMTIHNSATTPDGTFVITPTATVTGTVIVEFVL
jgi:hypothetical protein